ncbi:hypothetical protein F889_01656 [Acinetobacter colistiniresistens]|uniref:DUF2946 domain-containing protein n=1 Tax=Acinetobacter colistiniresistens TaxID=280145 RepID=N9PLL6_9GAMM|nr:hypothetical protein [Acinetobacter colistiniresistens]ENX34378.1 hypothetical protein F889_01656 [Acinetobacter colistiniresistens]
MQLLKRYKRLWFVFLMIFFIGGSGVAVAAVQAIQSDQNSSVSILSMACHDQQMMDQHHHMQSKTDSLSSAQCHDGKLHNDQHCQDCNSISHCQSVNLALDPQGPSLGATPFLELNTRTNTDYQARHLAGYWQEILRPPKA